jgi:hypothetical protein
MFALTGINGNTRDLHIFMVSYGWIMHLIWTSLIGIMQLRLQKLRITLINIFQIAIHEMPTAGNALFYIIFLMILPF